jgi:hypothetical protein
MSAKSLCFKEARDAHISGGIELEEYLHHIVSHYTGLRHSEDAEGQRPWFYAGFEDEVRKLVLSENYQPLDEDGKRSLAAKRSILSCTTNRLLDTTVIYSIFLSGFQGDVAAVRRLIDASAVQSEYYLRPLMEISTAEGHPELLRICFENGFLGTGYLDSNHLLSSRIRNNPSTAWLDVLSDVDFRQWRTNPQQLGEWQTLRHVFYMGTDCVSWWIEHGGRTPRARGVFEVREGWPGAATLQILLNQFGIDWFRDSGTLQLAVKNHDMETVKMLVEAGADVNEDVTDWQTDIREHRAAPLSALHEAVYAKDEAMIRFLVKRGARLPRKYITDPYNTTPKEFRVFKDLVAELGAIKE